MTNIRTKLDVVNKLEVLKSMLDENHSSNGIIKKYANAFKFRNDVDTTSLISNMLREFKVYDWIDAINEFCTSIRNDVNSNHVELTLESTLLGMKIDNKFNSYDGAISILEGLMAEELNADKLIIALQESTWIPAIKNLISVVESATNSVDSLNPDVTVGKVYSPVEINEDESFVFAMDGTLYEMDDYGITVSDKATSPLFNKLVQICEKFNIAEGKLKYNHKNQAIEIVINEDNCETFINGAKVNEGSVRSTLAASGAFYLNEMAVLEMIDFASQHANKIVEMDNITTIKSNHYDGVTANVVKLDESIFVNKINRSMMSNTLDSATATDAVAMVKEFVCYDVSNFVVGLLGTEEKFEEEISESKQLINDRITFLNEQLGNIYAAETEIGQSDELNQAKVIIKESLDNEQASLSALLTQKKSLNEGKYNPKNREEVIDILVKDFNKDARSYNNTPTNKQKEKFWTYNRLRNHLSDLYSGKKFYIKEEEY